MVFLTKKFMLLHLGTPKRAFVLYEPTHKVYLQDDEKSKEQFNQTYHQLKKCIHQAYSFVRGFDANG